MDGLVTQVLDGAALVKDGLADRVAESGFVDQRAQIFAVRQLQASVMLVSPSDRKLKGTAGIETGCPWIRIHQRFRPVRSIVHLREFGF